MKTIYNRDVKNLVFGALPDEAAIYATFNSIKNRLTTIKQTIQIENNQ
jgi:hypothetical protein